MALVRKIENARCEVYTLHTADGPIVIEVRLSQGRLVIVAPKTVVIDRGEIQQERKVA